MEIIKRKRLLENYRSRDLNNNYGEVTATTINIPIYLTQTYEDLGIYTDLDFEPFNDDYVGENKLNRGDIDLPPKFDPAIHGRHPLISVDGYDQYGISVTGEIDDRYLSAVSSYLIGEDGNPLFIPKLNMSNNISESFSGVLDIDDNNIITYVIDGNVDNDGNYVTDTGIIYQTTLDIIVSNLGNTKRWSQTLYTHTMGGLRTVDRTYLSSNAELKAIYKEEDLLNIVEPPKVRNRVFINRGGEDIFERHSIMSEIKTRDDIDEYRDGYF